MLSAEDNNLLCKVGPGSVRGDFIRQYWLPALMSLELPKSDGDPMRVRLLGENLIAFRDTSGTRQRDASLRGQPRHQSIAGDFAGADRCPQLCRNRGAWRIRRRDDYAGAVYLVGSWARIWRLRLCRGGAGKIQDPAWSAGRRTAARRSQRPGRPLRFIRLADGDRVRHPASAARRASTRDCRQALGGDLILLVGWQQSCGTSHGHLERFAVDIRPVKGHGARPLRTTRLRQGISRWHQRAPPICRTQGRHRP